MAGTANIFAADLVSIHDAISDRDLDRARSEWERLYPLMDAIMSAPFVSAVKAALNATGVAVGNPRLPVLPLEPEAAADIVATGVCPDHLADVRRQRPSADLLTNGSQQGASMTVTDHPFNVVRRADPTSLDPAILPPAGHFIDGSFADAPDAERLDVVDPASEDLIVRVANGTADDVDRAVAAAVKAKDQWARLVPKERSEVLHAIADRIAENRDVLVRLESANTGKPASVAGDDVDGTIDTFRFMAGALRGTSTMAAGDYVESHLSVILREPLGVVGVVTPWNYPLLMAAWKLAPILAAGNTVVIKPSEQTPLSTLKLAEAGRRPAPSGRAQRGDGARARGRLSAWRPTLTST